MDVQPVGSHLFGHLLAGEMTHEEATFDSDAGGGGSVNASPRA
jgi:hypothetical protein